MQQCLETGRTPLAARKNLQRYRIRRTILDRRRLARDAGRDPGRSCGARQCSGRRFRGLPGGLLLPPAQPRASDSIFFSRIDTNIRAVLQRSAEANELECGAQFLGVDGDGLCRGQWASPSQSAVISASLHVSAVSAARWRRALLATRPHLACDATPRRIP
jgi:hypothetical protein